MGSRTEECTIGICDWGEFDILLGNDAATKFRITINVADRYCTYFHPHLGR